MDYIIREPGSLLNLTGDRVSRREKDFLICAEALLWVGQHYTEAPLF